MKEQIAQIEAAIKAITAEDNKRAKTQPPNPHLQDAITRGRVMVASLNRYVAQTEADAKLAAAADAARLPEAPAKK
jgi:hypothetical protein